MEHGVRVCPGGPLRVLDTDLSAYLGCDLEEFLESSGSSGENLNDEVAVQEFTPGTGLVSCTGMPKRAARSHAKWSEFTASQGVPVWFGADALRRLRDCLMYLPGHVKQRQQVKEKVRRSKYHNGRADKRHLRKLEHMRLMELSCASIHHFTCSPAQFAALAVRSGTVLGEYCDNRHKAGRAKVLYEHVRKEAR